MDSNRQWRSGLCAALLCYLIETKSKKKEKKFWCLISWCWWMVSEWALFSLVYSQGITVYQCAISALRQNQNEHVWLFRTKLWAAVLTFPLSSWSSLSAFPSPTHSHAVFALVKFTYTLHSGPPRTLRLFCLSLPPRKSNSKPSNFLQHVHFIPHYLRW